MASGRVNLAVMLQNQRVPCSSQPLDALFLSASSPSFLGTLSLSLISLCMQIHLHELGV